ncbi:MAG: SDR family NAD(P)-dependent oxidoreductase, partial [Burkholderiales bacterium]
MFEKPRIYPDHPGTALVTGASTRIGAAIARALAGAGHAVVVHYRSDETRAQSLAAQITARGGRAATIKADLANRADRASLIAAAQKPFGPLTI